MTPRRPLTVSAALSGKFIQYAASRGLDPKTLLHLVGIGPEEARDPERRVPLAAHNELWAHVARALDDPGLPVHMAQQMRIEDFHVMGFAISTSRGTREALDRLCRYNVLFIDGGRWELNPASAKGLASLEIVRSSTFSLGERLLLESGVATCLSCFRQCSGNDFAPARVTFRHPAPRDLSAHQRFFRCPVEFSSQTDGYWFAADLLDATQRTYNPALSAFFARYAEELRRAALETDSTTDRVRDAIARDLASGEPSMAAVAKHLGMSERSLRRHLSDEGTSFRDMVEDVRRRTAETLLREGKVTLPDVAFLLGFSDVSTFTRAFKRWCGVPPGKFRESGLGART